jgi:hypothetical protein
MSKVYTPRIIVLVLLLVSSWAPADPAPSAPPDAEQDKVVEAMNTMYVAATNDDLAQFHTVAAPDFYAFDGGKRFNGDALMELIKTAHAAGKIYVWRVTEPEVHIEGEMCLDHLHQSRFDTRHLRHETDALAGISCSRKAKRRLADSFLSQHAGGPLRGDDDLRRNSTDRAEHGWRVPRVRTWDTRIFEWAEGFLRRSVIPTGALGW